MKKKFLVIVIAVTVVIAVGAIIGAYYQGDFGTTNTGKTVYFTIVEDSSGTNEGMNGSAYKVITSYWPVIHVQLGDNVVIHVINNSTVEAHGFSIYHYFNAGVTVREGMTYDVKFTANLAGTFKISCNIQCSVHPLMQMGELIVS